MLNLEDLQQFAAFYELGTLSKVAEELHISQPTITRTMQRVEDAFGVSLFVRGKNRIELNPTGLYAAAQAVDLLKAAQNTQRQVKAYDEQLRTIAVAACAPAPLWSILPLLSEKMPEKSITSKLCDLAVIVEGVRGGDYSLGILPYSIEEDGISCKPYLFEGLSVCVPKHHELADRETITLQELNGFNCLLGSNIGFWNELVQRKMPASRFLVQTDEFAFRELVRASSLPCFITNLAHSTEAVAENRIAIPVTDAEANVTYHLIYASRDRQFDTLTGGEG